MHVKQRISDNDFISSMRTVLANHYNKSGVIGKLLLRISNCFLFRIFFSGMGGVFWIKDGVAYQHIMPNFSRTPLNDDHDLNEWLYFYNMSSPLIGVGTFVTGNYVIHKNESRLSLQFLYSNQQLIVACSFRVSICAFNISIRTVPII